MDDQIKSIDAKELLKLISDKAIKNVDLSSIDLNGYSFSKCEINNVVFNAEGKQGRELKNINFKDAKITDSSFDNATLESCNFDGSKTELSKVSFKKCNLIRCRFRKASFSWCDFRYTEINSATFEESIIDFCDFYRALLVGVIIFRKSKISNSSIYYAYFGEGASIRKENFVKGMILQQDEDNYYKFLSEWEKHGPGIRKNDCGTTSDWSHDASLKARYADAEDIYKTLNGLWMSKGYFGDANWAYVKGKKMERNRMKAELSDVKISIFQKLKRISYILWNYISDAMFGYGESMIKMIVSYIVLVFLFAYFYYAIPEVLLSTYDRAVKISLKNMVAMSSDEITNISPLVDFLNVVQTTTGILITGIFGFILGNKIRNQ